jgi:hypothetical protein
MLYIGPPEREMDHRVRERGIVQGGAAARRYVSKKSGSCCREKGVRLPPTEVTQIGYRRGQMAVPALEYRRPKKMFSNGVP